VTLTTQRVIGPEVCAVGSRFYEFYPELLANFLYSSQGA